MKLTLPGWIRFVVFPFPFAVALFLSLLVIADHLFRPDRSRIEAGGPEEAPGTVAIVLLVLLFQVVWGIPSLLWLKAERAGFRGHAIVGALSSLLLCVGSALMLQAPQFGETFSWMLLHALLFFGIPLFLSYLLAHSLRPDAPPTG